MAVTFHLAYQSAADYARHLLDHRQQGVLLLPLSTPPELQQYEEICLHVEFPGAEAALEAQVVQVIAGLGVAVQLQQPETAETLVAGAAPAAEAAAPVITLSPTCAPSGGDAPPDQRGGGADDSPPPGSGEAPDPAPRAEGIPRGSSPLSWPIEKLQSEWQCLSMADKVRLAKHGKRPARALIMRLQDQQLHSCLLTNPKIAPDEVAVMAGKANLHPDLIKRIVTSQEWLRHTNIVRNLICNPKITTPQLTKLINHLPSDELRRLARTGKVRASAKQLIIRKLDQQGGRRR